MAAIIRAMAEGYKHLSVRSDPRPSNWLMTQPWAMVATLGAYLYFVNSLGPRLMKDRPPYKVEGIMKIYNLVQILASGWIVKQAMTLCWMQGYIWVGQPVDYTLDPRALGILEGCWTYSVIKVVDLLDTVFFILRKKESQVTFLHVYHHAGMAGMSWAAVKFFGGGHVVFLGTINSFVHVIMYSYYLITAISPEYKKYIWWKRHITHLQMAQFLALTLQNLLLVLKEDAEFPRWIGGILVIQNLFMLVLFYDFYRKAYMTKKTKKFS